MDDFGFQAKKEAFDWKEFQKHMGYTDQELEAFKAHPKKGRFAPRMFNPELLNKYLIIEIVESNGCACNHKPGDRLYFKGYGVLDKKRGSDFWCSHALAHISLFADTLHNFFVQGADVNEMYYDHFSCPDVGSKYGWGQVIMKAYVVDQSDLDKLD